jgi:hypothetical protein
MLCCYVTLLRNVDWKASDIDFFLKNSNFNPMCAGGTCTLRYVVTLTLTGRLVILLSK